MHSVSQTEATKGNDTAQPVKTSTTKPVRLKPGQSAYAAHAGTSDVWIDAVCQGTTEDAQKLHSLYSAAPEMLKALKIIVGAADSPSQGENQVYFDIHRVFIRAARLAIAKATNV